ncbi:MAG: DUF5693 family protein [Armatimonadota bacterium]
MSPERPILWLLLTIGLIASLYVAVLRDGAERANTSVELGIEYQEARKLATLAGVEVEDVLRGLRNAGATTLIVYEDTLESLQEAGAMFFMRVQRHPGVPPQLEAHFHDQSVAGRVLRNISGRLPVSAPWDALVPAGWFPVPKALADMPELGVGLDEEARADAAATELRLVARPAAWGVNTPEGMEFVAEEMKEAGAEAVIFAGNVVLGSPGHAATAAAALSQAGLLYGSVEFGKQLGDLSLSHALDGRVLRVHAITELEMTTVSAPVAVERFVRAVRERDVRFCYVRLFLDSRADVLGANTKYLGALAERLRGKGFALGAAEPFEAIPPRPWASVAACVGVVAGVLLLLGSLGRLRMVAWLALAVLGILVALAGLWASPTLCRKLFALLAALTFPTLAVVRLHHLQSSESRGYGGALGRALGAYVVCAGISLCGALLVVGLLSDRLFMVKVAQFTGVKLSLHLPLLAVGAVYLGALFASEPSWREQWRLAVDRWRAALATVVPYGHVLIVIVLLAGAAVVMLRSGNEPGFGLSQIELSFRSALERILVVRPRQKEFLVGHPLLLLSIALVLCGPRRQRNDATDGPRTTRGTWLLLACATIGQTSLVNTFCHIHTPLRISLLRTVNGLWVGAILGLVLVVIYWIAWRPLQADEAPSSAPSQGPKRRRRAEQGSGEDTL